MILNKKEPLLKQNSSKEKIIAQGAIEYLLIIGAAILVVAIVIFALTTLAGSGSGAIDEEQVNTTYNPLEEQKAEMLNKHFIPQGTSENYIYSGPETTLKTLQESGENIDVCVNEKCNDETSIDNEYNNIITIKGVNDNGTMPKNNLELTEKSPFKCGDDLIDLRDNQNYKTVLINEQCWMAQNINVGTMVMAPTNHNDPLIQGTSCSSINKWCYSNNETNCNIYGGLYQWTQAVCEDNNPQGICPTGWHISTKPEWDELNNFILNNSNKLKVTSINNPSWNGNNETGFSALPSGYLSYNNMGYNPQFTKIGVDSFFWTATNGTGDLAISKLIFGSTSNIQERTLANKPNGYPIRCIKD